MTASYLLPSMSRKVLLWGHQSNNIRDINEGASA